MKLTGKVSVIILIVLFAGRTVYGLFSEFWFEDELQIYLIGLKAFTTGTWPFYGPDVVYTGTQIPGALQGLLISVPLYLLPLPESPALFLNILSFSSLLLLAFYLSKQFGSFPKWMIWCWVMTLTWTMDFSTRTVNPSYVIVFSIPFFIALSDISGFSRYRLFGNKAGFFIMGISLTLIMQLHLSYILLIPFIIYAFAISFRKESSSGKKISSIILFITGAVAGLITLIPTWCNATQGNPVTSNIVFHPENFKNIITVLTRFFSFASYEIPYILGGNTASRLEVIKENIWMAPFAVYLLLFGMLMVLVFIVMLFMRRNDSYCRKYKYFTISAFLMLWLSFFFSVKGPSSHTFYLLLPVAVIYSFYCHEWLVQRFPVWRKLMIIALISVPFFYAGTASYNFSHKSMYKDRQKIVNAIEKKDYRILGERRTAAAY